MASSAHLGAPASGPVDVDADGNPIEDDFPELSNEQYRELVRRDYERRRPGLAARARSKASEDQAKTRHAESVARSSTRRSAPARAGRAATSLDSKIAKAAKWRPPPTPAGFVLGMILYAQGIGYVRSGWPGVRNWWAAKFLNRVKASPSPGPSTRSPSSKPVPGASTTSSPVTPPGTVTL